MPVEAGARHSCQAQTQLITQIAASAAVVWSVCLARPSIRPF